MPDAEGIRPRRAMSPTDPVDDAWTDDTPESPRGARRAAPDYEFARYDAPPVAPARSALTPPDDVPTARVMPARSATSPSEWLHFDEEDDEPEVPLNPFARPGSASARQSLDTPIPRPALPGRKSGHRAAGKTPVPRRSADSSLSPAELADAAESPASPTAGSEPAQASWVKHHKKRLWMWASAALALVLLIGIVTYVVRTMISPGASPVTAAPSSPAVSPSASGEALATEANLLDEAAAKKISASASWAVTNTSDNPASFPARATCLSKNPSQVNPVSGLQRTLGTSEDNKLAALHQVDVYASAEAAQQVMQDRKTALVQCADVPAYIVSSSHVENLADEAFQVTVAYQNDPDEFHTVLLTRTGRAVSVVDVVQHSKAVPADTVVQAIAPKLQEICGAVEGKCPANPSAKDAVVAPAEPKGWLIGSDLPRVKAGEGTWTGGEVGPATVAGSGCENLTLANAPGPTDRKQRTFVLTQAEGVPTTFGVDEVQFTFPDAAKAQAFIDKLSSNIKGCSKRLLAAKVSEPRTVTAKDDAGKDLKITIFDVKQAKDDKSAVESVVMLSVVENRAFYNLLTVTPDYRFTDDQLNAIAARTAQRLTQQPS